MCSQCGATVYPSERMTLLSELGGDMQPSSPRPAPSRGAARVGWLLVALLLAAGAVWAWREHRQTQVSPEALQRAVEASLTSGGGPGSDPVCVANGLAYDDGLVHVQRSNDATLAWMEALVRVGLYAPVADAAVQTHDGAPVQAYRPLPALEGWGGERRLCMARAVRLQSVRNLGSVQSMRFRGEAYPGVVADVVWAPEAPAPWLAAPETASLLAAQWPAWRGARWASGPGGWTLVQRRHFFLHQGQWVTSESLERRNDLPPRPAPPL